MTRLELTADTDVSTVAGNGEGPSSITAEIERALRLVNPSMNDHKSAAMALRMVLQKRGIEVVIMGQGVPLQ
jgi:hypothetical protein